jgi:hypothetical protein
VIAPQRERELADELAAAIAEGSIRRLNGLLTADAVMFRAPDGTAHWSRPAERYDRNGALKHLGQFISRDGTRRHRVNYYTTLLPYSRFLVDISFEGYGNYIDPASGKARSVYGSICGEDPRDWEGRLVLAYQVDGAPGETLRIESLIQLA